MIGMFEKLLCCSLAVLMSGLVKNKIIKIQQNKSCCIFKGHQTLAACCADQPLHLLFSVWDHTLTAPSPPTTTSTTGLLKNAHDNLTDVGPMHLFCSALIKRMQTEMSMNCCTQHFALYQFSIWSDLRFQTNCCHPRWRKTQAWTSAVLCSHDTAMPELSCCWTPDWKITARQMSFLSSYTYTHIGVVRIRSHSQWEVWKMRQAHDFNEITSQRAKTRHTHIQRFHHSKRTTGEGERWKGSILWQKWREEGANSEAKHTHARARTHTHAHMQVTLYF